MELRRGAVAFCSAAALICSVTLAAQAPRKLTKAEEKERDAISKIVASVTAGQPLSGLRLDRGLLPLIVIRREATDLVW